MVTLRITDNSEQALAFIELARTFPFIILEEEEEDGSYLTEEQKAILEERVQEDNATYLTKEEFFEQLEKRYSLVHLRKSTK